MLLTIATLVFGLYQSNQIEIVEYCHSGVLFIYVTKLKLLNIATLVFCLNEFDWIYIVKYCHFGILFIEM